MTAPATAARRHPHRRWTHPVKLPHFSEADVIRIGAVSWFLGCATGFLLGVLAASW
jgi:hypothetical protein